MRTPTVVALVAFSFSIGACSGPDGGTDAAVDVGVGRDVGAVHDGGSPIDVGPGHDVGPGVDGGSTTDAATTTDSGTPVDAGHDAATPPDAGHDAATDAGASTRAVPVGHCGGRSGLYFPASSWMYTDIHGAAARSNSASTTAWLGSHGGWNSAGHFQIDFSMHVNDVTATTPSLPVTERAGYYTGDCDHVATFPTPAGGRIEDTTGLGACSGDCHLLVVDFTNHVLFESYQSAVSGGHLLSTCVIPWNMTHDSWGTPPAAGAVPNSATRNWGDGLGCTSTDAAGFPVAPMLVTVGDVMSGRVEHAIRFILPNARMQLAATAGAPGPVWVWPATHAGGPEAVDPNAPIYGSRWRLHDPFDYAAHGMDGTNAAIRAIVYGLQHYGMVLADGGDIPLSFEGDEGCAMSWDDVGLDSHSLFGITPADFDVLETGGTGHGYDCQSNPAR